MASDVCRLCGLDAKEHRRMESDKRRGFHEFATPIDDEQAAQEICRILGGKGYPFVHNAAIDKVLDLLRSREQAAYREGQERMREQVKRMFSGLVPGEFLEWGPRSIRESIDALQIEDKDER